jgi:hypothetical protein
MHELAKQAAQVVQIERALTHRWQPLGRPLEGERVAPAQAVDLDLGRARVVGLVLSVPLPARARHSGSRGRGHERRRNGMQGTRRVL